jgi:hypothetical protein
MFLGNNVLGPTRSPLGLDLSYLRLRSFRSSNVQRDLPGRFLASLPTKVSNTIRRSTSTFDPGSSFGYTERIKVVIIRELLSVWY